MSHSSTLRRSAPALLVIPALVLFACSDTTRPADPVSVSLNLGSAVIALGDTVSLRAELRNASNPGLTWRSSEPGIVQVTPHGDGTARVTAMLPGSAVITVVSVQDTTRRAQVDITVPLPQPGATSLRLVPDELDLPVGGTLRLDVRAAAGGSPPVSWATSASTIVSVDATGQVTALADGVATITAVSVADPRQHATAVVRVGATGPLTISLGPASYSIPVGAGTTFIASVRNHWNTAVIWRSADPAIATVTPTGNAQFGPRMGTVVGVSLGTTRITAISAQDTMQRAHIEMSIIELPGFNVFRVDPPHADLDPGATLQLRSLVGDNPADALWRSSDPAIASVSGTGLVTTHAVGNAAITALLASDTTRAATSFIRVGAAGPVTLPQLGLGRVDERYTGEVAVHGNWAYTSTWGNRNGTVGNTVKVWDVSGNAPVLAHSLVIPGARTTGDVQISDDGALLVVAVEPNPEGAIIIYDRTNPAQPDSIARYATARTRQGVHTVKLGRVNGRHYAFLSVNPGTLPAALVIVDITDPRNPTEVWSQAMGRPFVHDVFVRDGLLFAALWHDGLRIFDIGGGGRGGSPSAPVVLGNIPTVSGSIHNIWWFHDPANGSKRYVFLGEEGPGTVPISSSGDLHVIDITDPGNPIQVAQYGVAGAGAHNFWMDEPSGILYAAFYNGGVRALDVRGDLGTCAASARNARGFCDLRQMGRERGVAQPAGAYIWGVVHEGTRVFASDMRAGLYVFDATALKR